MTQEELFRLRQTGAEVQRILDAEGTMAEQAAAAVGAAESANEAAQQVNDALQEIIETGDIPAATVAKVAEHTVQIGNLEALIFDISANNPTEGHPTPYANLAAALGEGGANVPESMRKGGMSVKFVQSSDNKYVQYRLMSDSFNTTIANWQGVDDEPTVGSDNLVKSGGVNAALSDIKPSQINGESQDIIKELEITFIDGEYKREAHNGNIDTITMSSLTTIEFNVDAGDIILLKLTQDITEGLYPAYFIFAKNNSTAAILSSDIPNYIELVDENEKLWKLTVPPQTTKIFSATNISDKDIVYAQKLLSSKELKWLLVQESNLSQSLQDKINGDITPNRIYSDEFVFDTEQYIVQSYTEGGYIYVQGDYVGSTISIANNNTIHSAIIPVQEGDVLLVKNGQNIDPLDTLARYYYAFGYTDNPLKSCVALADYPNYISAYNDTQYLIHIPKDCGYFYFTILDNSRADDNVKVCVVKQNLKWLEISQDNMSQEAVSAIISSMISNQSFSTLVANISENAQQTREAEYHLWDSICKKIDFTGKTIKFFGDSITAGTCSPNLGNADNDRYSSTFCRLVGANESNYAIGGSCITDSQEGDQYNIGTRVKQYTRSTDEIIIIAGGTNDFNQGRAVGTFGDTQRTTFYGSLDDICSYLQTTIPNAVVIFITPIPYTKPESAYPSHIASLNTYRSAIYDVATKYGYNVVDGNSIGMPRMQGGWNNIMCDDSDGCHPTVEGHKLMARNITGKLL